MEHARGIAEKASGLNKNLDALNIQSLKIASQFNAATDLAIPRPSEYAPLRDLPTHEEKNQYQSASVLLRRLAESITQWRSQLPANELLQPAVLALLNGGVQIEVETLAQESFHGI